MSHRRAVARRLLGGVAVALLLAAAVASALPGASRSTATPPEPTSATAGPSPSAGGAPSDGSSAGSTPSGSADEEDRRTTDVPPVPLPTSGPWLTEPGSLLVAVPERDGSFTVVERVLLPEPATGLELAPPDLAGAGSSFEGTTPEASDLQVSAGGQPVRAVSTVDGPVPLTWDVPTDRVELRYRLTGATVMSTPSVPGRALGAVAPLAGPEASEPVVLVVTGPSVLNLSCPLLPDPTCSATGDGFLTLSEPLPPEQSLVLVQLDLPTPG
ncbi:hypothetical protein [Auraticoccus monumenti]|uniref:Uncharacterized protein n=1 Tax=Auraticoccus monumenti TaxID=675864 RepID=A0A1G7EHR2_9ACTN|nr:hypothetical protein [Auraticoccus monumenti]SDE63178.1 hypothetical protein SAMN04489747_3948 [Auraticoccus monumenti]